MSTKVRSAPSAGGPRSGNIHLLGVDFSAVLNSLASEPSAVFIYPVLLVLIALPAVLAEVEAEFSTYVKIIDIYRAMAIVAFVPAGLSFYRRRPISIESLTLSFLAYCFFVLLFPTKYAVAFIYGCMIVYSYICVQGNTRFIIIIVLLAVWWSERFNFPKLESWKVAGSTRERRSFSDYYDSVSANHSIF